MKIRKNKMFSKVLAAWSIIVLVAALLWLVSNPPGPGAITVPYSELVSQVKAGNVTGLEIKGSTAVASLASKNSKPIPVVAEIPSNSTLVSEALDAGVAVKGAGEEGNSLWVTMLMAFGPTLLLIGVWLFVMKRMQGGGANRVQNVGSSRASVARKEDLPVRFADVAGCDEAKEEVMELVEFLSNPKKFEKLGGYIPKGVLMAGPPGTGKTLLAKAIAGEAGVPFFSISGSDFVEMFVGVGAARVRSLFEQAKANAPCIVFIDEIDAVGRHRGAGMGGGNDEREQTLNQLLVEMNGFQPNSGIIVIAATNRPEVLDPALTRPGRFDRTVNVGLPDIRGRAQILRVHLRKVPVATDVSVEDLARGTPGFAGADLQNLVNEAALFAARANKLLVDMADFEKAKDKVTMGVERKSIRMPESERVNTAYHEAGHAVIAKLLPTADPVHKVSIIPRGRALGVTLQLPEEDRYSLSRSKILDNMAILFGGRLAEDIFTGEITTGASNDFERATSLARNMVTRWGMSDTFGQLVIGDMNLDPFGRSQQAGGTLAEDTLQKADSEVRRILEEQYNRARDILMSNQDKMHAMANALLKWETIDADQINDIMKGLEPRPPKDEVIAPIVQGPTATPQMPTSGTPVWSPATAQVSE